MVQKITISNANILEPFVSNPKEKLHLALISRYLGVPHPTLRRWLNEYEKKGILKKSFQGRLTLYSLNYENPLLIDYLASSEKNRLIARCEDDLRMKEIVQSMHNITGAGVKVIIFGSSIQNLDKANDIDILVLGSIELKLIKNLSKKINKEIHLIALKNLNNVSESLKTEIIKKHLIVKGLEDVVRWLFW